MKRRTFIFSYSGDWEGTRKFHSFVTLKRFINKIPDHDLKNTSVTEKKGEYLLVGKYFRLKKGGISIEF